MNEEGRTLAREPLPEGPSSERFRERNQTTQEIKKLAQGNAFKGIFVVLQIFQRSDKRGHPYWDLSVMDSEGILEAKVWSDAKWWDCRVRDTGHAASPLSVEEIGALKGKTIGVKGKVVDFKGQAQINLTCLCLLDQEAYPPSEYVRKSPIPLEDLERRFERLIASCRPELEGFLRQVFCGELLKRFRDYPAAVSHHHAYAHGLLEHTVSVAEVACSLARTYQTAGFPVDVDLTVAGALLHDIGKTEAYILSPVPEMTTAGAVLDHVAIGYALFDRFAKTYGLKPDLALALAHILLSHHGLKEYGSPVLPATPEALIVSAADELDFRLFCWTDSIEGTPEGQEISAFNGSTQRRFWRGAPREME